MIIVHCNGVVVKVCDYTDLRIHVADVTVCSSLMIYFTLVSRLTWILSRAIIGFILGSYVPALYPVSLQIRIDSSPTLDPVGPVNFPHEVYQFTTGETIARQWECCSFSRILAESHSGSPQRSSYQIFVNQRQLDILVNGGLILLVQQMLSAPIYTFEPHTTTISVHTCAPL